MKTKSLVMVDSKDIKHQEDYEILDWFEIPFENGLFPYHRYGDRWATWEPTPNLSDKPKDRWDMSHIYQWKRLPYVYWEGKDDLFDHLQPLISSKLVERTHKVAYTMINRGHYNLPTVHIMWDPTLPKKDWPTLKRLGIIPLTGDPEEDKYPHVNPHSHLNDWDAPLWTNGHHDVDEEKLKFNLMWNTWSIFYESRMRSVISSEQEERFMTTCASIVKLAREKGLKTQGKKNKTDEKNVFDLNIYDGANHKDTFLTKLKGLVS